MWVCTIIVKWQGYTVLHSSSVDASAVQEIIKVVNKVFMVEIIVLWCRFCRLGLMLFRHYNYSC